MRFAVSKAFSRASHHSVGVDGLDVSCVGVSAMLLDMQDSALLCCLLLRNAFMLSTAGL